MNHAFDVEHFDSRPCPYGKCALCSNTGRVLTGRGRNQRSAFRKLIQVRADAVRPGWSLWVEARASWDLVKQTHTANLTALRMAAVTLYAEPAEPLFAVPNQEALSLHLYRAKSVA